MTANSNSRARPSSPGSGDVLSEIGDSNLGRIVAAASDITLVIDGAGTILSLLVNERSTDLGNLDHWVGRPIHDFLTRESVPKLDSLLEKAAAGTYSGRGVELNHRDNAVWEFPIEYTLHPLETPETYLLLGRDLRPVAETQRQLVQAQIALERGYEAQREFDSRYRLLLATVTDAIALVSLSDGRITDMNDQAAELLGTSRKELVGAVFASQFAGARRGDMESRLMNAALSEGASPLEMSTQRGGRAVRVVPNVFRVGGDRVAICRLEAPAATAPAPPESGLARALRTLFDQGVEAMVFTDPSGVIRHANDRFLEMVDAGHLSEVKGRHVSEFLSRGQVDFGVLSENVIRGGHLRLYATEMISDYGSRTPAEVSAAMLREGREEQIALVIRDAARVEAVRLPGSEAETASQQNILELVGSASLKEIVAETNDVIEKLCIETAIRLTNNNRVAAAEMLGLSRQSLYVKLRKYGLVKKTDDE